MLDAVSYGFLIGLTGSAIALPILTLLFVFVTAIRFMVAKTDRWFDA